MWRARYYPVSVTVIVGTLFFSLSILPSEAQSELNLFLPVVHALPLTRIHVTTQEDELNTDGDCSLREAIQAANTDQGVDDCLVTDATNLIVLPVGVYQLTLAGAHEDLNFTGDLDITGTVTISGTGGSPTIDGNQLDRVLHILPNSRVTLNQITIANGKTANGADSTTGRGEDSDSGGGIANSGALTLTASLVTNSSTGDGGAGFFDGINPGYVGGNAGHGGAIWNAGDLQLIKSQLLHNQTGNGGANGRFSCRREQPSQGGSGGGLYNLKDSTVTIVATTLADNHTGHGAPCVDPPGILGGNGANGGAIANFGVMRLTQSTLHSNGSGAGGGGGGSHTIGGAGGVGGGIFNHGALQASNSTISGNHTGAGGSGGVSGGGHGGNGAGIATLSAVTLDNVTISANVTGEGGFGFNQVKARGGYGGGIYAESVVTVGNSLIGGNLSPELGRDCTGLLKAYGGNLLQDASNCAVVQVGNGAVIHQDPLLAPLADNGGLTWTHALKTGSPAVDAATCSNAAGSIVTTDQRGIARPRGAGCDLGAYEF